MSDHKTNQAMLPPDPGGLNRALDRVAAEHLREVAPHLAPSAPAPPQPEPRTCHCGAYTASECECRKRAPNAPPQLERDELGRLCVNGQPHRPADPRMLGAPFCVVCYHPLAPAPPAEAKHHEEDCVCRECRPEMHSAQPPAEAPGEMSREELEGTLWLLSDEKGRDGTGAREVRTILAAFDSLRTRAREAEYKAEARQANIVDTNRTLERVVRERDEARRMIAGVQPDDRAALAVNILRVWPRAEIETFARHLLGDREQESLLLGQLQTQLEIVTREHDEAREQRDDLTEQIGRGQRLLSDTLRERDAAIGQVAEACRERDLFERERDEAREQLAKEREGRA